jgi:uncharacterized cupredoxin-like copper-binding protein
MAFFVSNRLENCVEGKENYSGLIMSFILNLGEEEKMKRFTLLSIIILVTFLVAACSSPAPAATQAPATEVPSTQPAATEAPTEPAATEAVPTQSGSVETAPAGDGTQVDITLADNTIESPVTTFQVSVPYTFVITNTGRHAHNFNINPPVSITGSLEAALSSALLAVPQAELGPGASVTVAYTFPEDAAGQLLEFSCLIRRHYEDGMLLGITVTE